ncbi:tyrosine--tRNA ligase [Candidatus Shapirobacteria bacterium CG_4_9_14_0_2_um_filter_39_11]|uniref:Tyrosine--tRNA ligase n=1 Tax=Candidatus Shapirobacteria bacterium CG_4_9_14_0_2_um_filter_39_11 TaxID=1974478 RepID=A0A2M8ES93_9BACT|nr:MAG: tyrosine--tRNA ligase [Candidatus Shapirobacteria bacterium CG_4_9_14_0_2_um_filter_39_11]
MKEMEPRTKQLLIQLEQRLLTEHRDLSALSAEEQFRIIADKVADHPEAITPVPQQGNNELLQKLKRAKERGGLLTVKFGIDPTGPEMHLGHAVPILMLRRFQQMGYKIQFVVGDFTARIGDPSGRLTGRPILTEQQIRENMRNYFEEAGLILDLNKKGRTETFYNSEWLGEMRMQDWLPLLQRVSASQMFQREDFQKRLEGGSSISMAELMYALFMAYDSVALKPDIEIGGIDQFLNLYWCRELMRFEGMKSEIFIVTNLLAGTSGETDSEGRFIKMGKSKKNYISVTENPREMYGKVMSIPDEVMWIWFRELTEISSEELKELKTEVEKGEIHPMDAKRMLARVVVGTFNHYDRNTIEKAERAFNQMFGKAKQLIPEDIKVITVTGGSRLVDILSKATGESKSNLKRMLASSRRGGIRILVENEYIPLTMEELSNKTVEGELIIKVGKRRYYRIQTAF